ncbi:VOC family protein [Sphingomonas sp. LB-2]|uniref:VOC family protein n=1 Tax=Sphingomonas caeni TaxID=2984949 RepID=UPI0022309857|nr:VOC family protein [Sphingomonas caeni]MCW3849007.1 VOC family protein [Sphingomonas caeni]
MMLKNKAKLGDKPASAILAVRDLDRARRFYGETLELEPGDHHEQVVAFRTGDTQLLIYKSEFAGTNKANAVVWYAGADFDALADQLRANGVTFEEYPEMGMEIAGGVHSQGDFKAVWFKDPDGNILHFNNM